MEQLGLGLAPAELCRLDQAVEEGGNRSAALGRGVPGHRSVGSPRRKAWRNSPGVMTPNRANERTGAVSKMSGIPGHQVIHLRLSSRGKNRCVLVSAQVARVRGQDRHDAAVVVGRRIMGLASAFTPLLPAAQMFTMRRASTAAMASFKAWLDYPRTGAHPYPSPLSLAEGEGAMSIPSLQGGEGAGSRGAQGAGTACMNGRVERVYSVQ